jgi:hypothetical protein
VDTYLRLSMQDEQVFQDEVDTLDVTEREGIMQIVTSWMEQGIAEGEQTGEVRLILRQLTRRLGTLPANVAAQVQALALPRLEALGEALLDFAGLDDLERWLQMNRSE